MGSVAQQAMARQSPAADVIVADGQATDQQRSAAGST